MSAFRTNNEEEAIRFTLMRNQAPRFVITQQAPSIKVVVERRVPRDKIDYKRFIPYLDVPRPILLQTIVRGDRPGFESVIQSMRVHVHPQNIYFWRHTNILHVAAVVGDVETLYMAKACGISVNATNENGSTPLHFACENNYTAAIKELIAMGSDTNAQDMFGNTPMMRAVIARVENSIETLTALGANPNIINYSGLTPAEMEKELNLGSAHAFQAAMTHAIYFVPRLVRRTCFSPPVQDAEYVALGSVDGQRGLSSSANIATAVSAEALLDDNDEDPEKIGESGNVDSSKSGLVHDVQAIQAEPVRLRTPSALRPRGLTMPPICGLFMTIMFLVVLVANAVCDINESHLKCNDVNADAQDACWVENSQCRASIDVSSGMRWGFLFILWIIAVIEAMNWGRKNLYYKLSSDRGFAAYLKFLASKPGRLRMDIACFHMVTREETTRDKDGRTSTRIREEKVYTHRASRYFNYDEFWLEHNDFEPFTGICMVSFSSDYELADNVTKELFEHEKKEFIQANDRDESFEFNVADEFQVPNGFVCLDGLASVKLIDYNMYTILSMLMLSVIYRMWINSISSKQTIHSKRFFWKA